MKLKSLYVKKYKNIVNLTIDFTSGKGFSILVGNNGVGKSNLLEVISGIFHDLFLDKTKRAISCDYRIEYEFNDVNCRIEQKRGNVKCYAPNLIDRARFIENNAPSNIIGLYSGEEDRLWTSFYKPYYMAYIRRIRGGGYQDRMRLIFINKYYWNIALLTLLLSNKECIKPFIEVDLGIKCISRIEFEFNLKHINDANPLLKAFIQKINPKAKASVVYRLEGLKQQIARGSGFEDYELFRCLAQAMLPKHGKIISRATISINGHFALQGLSEGEKKLILVKTILEIFSDEKTLVLMDEPDAHLHEARKEHLYAILNEHDKCQIVIATHSPTFIEMAAAEQVAMLKTDSLGNIMVSKIDRIEMLRALTGHRMNAFLDKPIIYCEGAGTSVEAFLYPILFPEYNVIPAGGHENVINLTKTYNKTFKENRAIGIIDWDYRNEAQISALKREKVFSLNVVEVENVLMDLALLEVARESFYSDDTALDNVRQSLFKECRKNKTYQAAKYTANRMVCQIKSSLSPESGTIDKFKSNVKKVCRMTNINAMYRARLRALEDFLRNEDFNEIVRIYDFNHNIDGIAKAVVDKYTSRILRLVQSSKDIQRFLKEKYYPEIR